MKNYSGMFFRLSHLGVGAGLRRWAVVLGLVCFGFVTVDVAQAGLYTQTYTLDGLAANNGTGVINVNQMDPTGWGVIDSITFTLTSTQTASMSAYNGNSSSGKITTFEVDGDVAVTFVDGTLVEIFPTDIAVSYPTTSKYTVNAGQTVYWTGVLGSDNDSGVLNSSSPGFSDFIGNGTVSATIGSDATVGFNGPTGFVPLSSATVDTVLTVTYDIVPEPGTWVSGALLLGVMGVGAGRSLRRKGNQAVA
jgi:hypothetical protein